MYSLDWPRVYGLPLAEASFKLSPEDFQVNELFDGDFSGEGEHILLKIEKRGVTTEDVLKSLSRLTGKPGKLLSYAGLKDKQALCTQWLSIHAPGEVIPGVETLEAPGWRVLESTRHHKKLRPGFLSANQFVITLRDLRHADDLLQRLEPIKRFGVPNYFGEQRFGRDAGNLARADELLVQGRKIKDRFLKGMYCSAARSWIFNLILAQRVRDNTWNSVLDGDVMQLAGSNSIFDAQPDDENLLRRIAEKDISPASPLPGRGKSGITGQALALVNRVYQDWQPWIDGLERLGLEEAWRANILHVDKISTRFLADDVLELTFQLPAGCYATTVLRELVRYQGMI